MLSGYCAVPLLVVEGGVVTGGGYLINNIGGSTNAGCASVEGFWVLVLVGFSGASDGDGFASTAITRGVVMSDGGGGADLAVMSTVPAITTVLDAATFPFPVSTASGGSLLL